MTVIDVVASALVLSGVLLSILGGVGLQRFPDVVARMHSATKPITLGLALVLGGTALLFLQDGQTATAAKLLLATALQFVTAPIAAHMVGRAAYRAGVPINLRTGIDDLRDAPPPAD